MRVDRCLRSRIEFDFCDFVNRSGRREEDAVDRPVGGGATPSAVRRSDCERIQARKRSATSSSAFARACDKAPPDDRNQPGPASRGSGAAR